MQATLPEVCVSEPKIVLWDIETTHNVVAAFQLKSDDYIPHDNILQERYIMSAAWKTLGAKKVEAVCVVDNKALYKKNPHSDLHVCTVLHKVLSEADIIIAHNGDWYDIKFTEARMLANGLPPLPPIQSIDTLKVARTRFLFNSNRLDYLGKFLRVGAKKHTSHGLWLRVLAGDTAALREIVAYNKQDVLLLERVFQKLRPYVRLGIHPVGRGGLECPRCGSKRTQRRGDYRTLTNLYPRFQCQACGGWFHDAKADPASKSSKRVL
jgi:RNase_H superfamily